MLCLLKLLHKALAKRRHIVADTSVSPFARTGNICCGHKFCVRDTKNVSDFVQKHFVSATNVSQFAQPKKHHEQQCVLYSAANDPQTGNDPQIGPQMIPNRKWSPMRNANDPARKWRMVWSLVSWIFLLFYFIFLSTKLLIR